MTTSSLEHASSARLRSRLAETTPLRPATRRRFASLRSRSSEESCTTDEEGGVMRRRDGQAQSRRTRIHLLKGACSVLLQGMPSCSQQGAQEDSTNIGKRLRIRKDVPQTRDCTTKEREEESTKRTEAHLVHQCRAGQPGREKSELTDADSRTPSILKLHQQQGQAQAIHRFQNLSVQQV